MSPGRRSWDSPNADPAAGTEPMTPAEVLAAAADKLDALAEASIGDWQIDDENHLGLVSITTPLSVRTSNANGRYSFTGPDDATTNYIAAMNPLVGKELAELLRAHAEVAATLEDMLVPEGPPTGHVYRLARLILGDES